MNKKLKIASLLLAFKIAISCMASLVSCEALFEGLGSITTSVGDATSGTKQDGSSTYPKPDGKLEVHVLDVGQGDSILLYTADGCALIDTSYNKNSVTDLEYLRSIFLFLLILTLTISEVHPRSSRLLKLEKYLCPTRQQPPIYLMQHLTPSKPRT